MEDALDHESLVEEGITGILCLNGFPAFIAHLGLFDWRAVVMDDGPNNPPELLEKALVTLRELAARHQGVLVHCAEGVSRSPFIVACFLAEEKGQDLPATIRWVKERHQDTIVSPQLLPLWDQYRRVHRNGAS